MAAIYWALCLFMSMAFEFLTVSSHNLDNTKLSNDGMDVINWSVGDCILARFNMTFSVYTDNEGNATNITLPSTAIVAKNNRSHCSKVDGERQSLSLSWNERQENDTTLHLGRFITLHFKRVGRAGGISDLKHYFYGVSLFYGEFEIARYNETTFNKTDRKTYTTPHKSKLIISSHPFAMSQRQENDKLMFETPQCGSYLCADTGILPLFSQMTWDYEGAASFEMHNTSVSATNVQLDAFRNPTDEVCPFSTRFRTAIDCDSLNIIDIVWMVIGISSLVAVSGCVIILNSQQIRSWFNVYQIFRSS